MLAGTVCGVFIFIKPIASSAVSKLLWRNSHNAADVQRKMALVAKAILKGDLANGHCPLA